MKTTIIFIVSLLFSKNYFPQNLPTWQRLPNAPILENGKFEDIYFVNDTIGWLVGIHPSPANTGAVYKTNDGGKTWIDQSFPIQYGAYFRSVGFINDSIGWCGNLYAHPLLNNLMYRTTNGGMVWFQDDNVPDSSLSGVCGIWVIDKLNIYACGNFGSNPGLLKTTDSGNSWQHIDLNPYATGAVDLYFFSPDTGFVVGKDITGLRAVVLATSDGGNTWVTKHTSAHTGEWAWKISFPTRNIGYVSLQTNNNDRYFLKTIDGGSNWIDLPSSGYTNFRPSGIGFVNDLNGWQGTHPGTDGGSIETTDGGLTWSINNSTKNINKFRIINDTLAYACGETVYKYTTEIISDVGENFPLVPIEFNLFQNFPNPFNPVTTILFTIPSEENVLLQVFNVNGELMETLIHKNLIAGSYEEIFVASKFPSGVYFYTLKAGSFTQTKKMILLK